MTEKDNPDDFISPLPKRMDLEFLNDRSWMPDSIRYELEMTDLCNDVILNFLFRKWKGTGRIPPLGNVNRNKSASPDTIRCPDGTIETVLLTDEECPNKRVNGVCVGDDKIINHLTDKAKCV